MTIYKKKDEHKAKIDFVITTTPFLDIGGMLVNSVLKSNVIAQHVVSDVGNKSKQNGTAGRQNYNKTISHWCILHKILSNDLYFVIILMCYLFEKLRNCFLNDFKIKF